MSLIEAMIQVEKNTKKQYCESGSNMNPKTIWKKIYVVYRGKDICSCTSCKRYYIEIFEDETHIHPISILFCVIILLTKTNTIISEDNQEKTTFRFASKLV